MVLSNFEWILFRFQIEKFQISYRTGIDLFGIRMDSGGGFVQIVFSKMFNTHEARAMSCILSRTKE